LTSVELGVSTLASLALTAPVSARLNRIRRSTRNWLAGCHEQDPVDSRIASPDLSDAFDRERAQPRSELDDESVFYSPRQAMNARGG